jgi:hypothetical protein
VVATPYARKGASLWQGPHPKFSPDHGLKVAFSWEIPDARATAPNLIEFGSSAYQRRSEQTSRLLGQLFERLQGEGLAVSFTMADFNRQYIKEPFTQLTPEERREALESLSPEERRKVLQSLPAEELLAVLSADQIRHYLEQLTAARPSQPRKPRRKK